MTGDAHVGWGVSGGGPGSGAGPRGGWGARPSDVLTYTAPGAITFVNRWREWFDARDGSGPREHQPPDFPETGPPRENDSFIRGPGESALRVARVAKFLAKAQDARPLQRLEVHDSTDNGTLSVGLDEDPAAEPGRGDAMTHFGFAELLVPRWPEEKEHQASLVDLDGVRLAPPL